LPVRNRLGSLPLYRERGCDGCCARFVWKWSATEGRLHRPALIKLGVSGGNVPFRALIQLPQLRMPVATSTWAFPNKRASNFAKPLLTFHSVASPARAFAADGVLARTSATLTAVASEVRGSRSSTLKDRTPNAKGCSVAAKLLPRVRPSQSMRNAPVAFAGRPAAIGVAPANAAKLAGNARDVPIRELANRAGITSTNTVISAATRPALPPLPGRDGLSLTHRAA
jgi:hypothetical protein